MKIPRVFIAATKQDEGKTTAALGLLLHFKKHFSNVGFMKPVGQRFVELDGDIKVDKDVWLIHESFDFDDKPELMSPVIIPRGFTKKYIDNRTPEYLSKKIIDSYSTLSPNKDFMLLEGTGHAGVGSVIDLSNARVAELLGSSVIIVTSGGIGRPIDEIMLNVALFKQRGVKIDGIILNKVLPNKIQQIKKYAGKAFAWHGLELLGVIPYVPMLSEPTLTEVCWKIKGKVISGKNKLSTLYSNVVLAIELTPKLLKNIQPRTLLVTTGSQAELLIACAGMEECMKNLREKIAGILLVENIEPKHHITKMLKLGGLPVIITEMSAFESTAKVSEMIAKTQPGNPEKVEMIDKLFTDHVNMNKIIEKACRSS